jgi:3-oxoacyl-[acyl-carrier protein] reductase
MSRVAVVTGGTGTIGRHTAAALIGDGWVVLAADLVPPVGDADQAEFVELDVTSSSSIEATTQRARSSGEVGALVVNHAIMEPTSPDAYDDALVQRVLEVNLKGALRVVHAIAPLMGAGGAIVLVSSVTASIGGIQGSYIYQASKAGLEQLTRHFAVALGERGIRVNCVAPGFMEHPPRGGGATVRASTSTGKRSRENPLGRRPTATEVAGVIAFLCSERASAVNGVVLPVDCGFLAM